MRAPVNTLTIAVFVALCALTVERAVAVGPAAVAKPGEPAPAFRAPDITGKTVGLADYAGKTVVLEWTNDGCPFVGKHYDSGNMQALQQKYMAEGVVWLTIASSAPGEQGYVTPAEAKADLAKWRAAPSDFLLDPDGVLGRLYDARATPHMVVIDPARTRRLYGRDRRQALDPPRRRQDRAQLRRRGPRRARRRPPGRGRLDPRLWVLDQVPRQLTANRSVRLPRRLSKRQAGAAGWRADRGIGARRSATRLHNVLFWRRAASAWRRPSAIPSLIAGPGGQQ